MESIKICRFKRNFAYNVPMKRNFLQFSYCLGKVSQNHCITNFFDRIFVTALLFEIFNFILFENDTTSDVILHNHFSKKLN